MSNMSLPNLPPPQVLFQQHSPFQYIADTSQSGSVMHNNGMNATQPQMLSQPAIFQPPAQLTLQLDEWQKQLLSEFKKAHKSNAAKRLTLSKLRAHLEAGTFPRDLDFKFHPFSTAPKSISPEILQAHHTNEMAAIVHAKVTILTARITLLEEDFLNSNTTLERYNSVDFLRESLLRYSPSLQNIPTVIDQYIQSFLVLKDHETRAPPASAVNATTSTSSEPMTEDAPAENPADLITIVAALRKDLDLLLKQKNQSGPASRASSPGRQNSAHARQKSPSSKSQKSSDSAPKSHPRDSFKTFDRRSPEKQHTNMEYQHRGRDHYQAPRARSRSQPRNQSPAPNSRTRTGCRSPAKHRSHSRSPAKFRPDGRDHANHRPWQSNKHAPRGRARSSSRN